MALPEPVRAKELFDEAADLPAPDRAAFLDRACGGDTALRAEVESLLGAMDKGAAFLAGRAPAGAPAGAPLEGPGTRLGPYLLLERIGEGGFGVVYLAEQAEPLARRVALKIIKAGMDTREVITRFEAERQALALMDHPNIAKVLDAGATATGRPYFVMELVRGEPITRYCDGAGLGTRERLELFMRVCQAVQHAHTKGIIHRDIKPSNVLVAVVDGAPVPKVIDFGIAKAIAAGPAARTLLTDFRQLVGTPEYMSPEQAAHAGQDVDTRSDVYSLGVLLYELLTGATPFDPERLRSAAWDEMLRIIREEEPAKPSTRLLGMRDTIASVAAVRRVEPARLARLVRGDLDWIAMRCLEKDRGRRYETAAGLALDIQHHLDDEPVSAGPPGAAYRMRKFARRHRAGVVGGGAVAVVLVLGMTGTTLGLLRAAAQRDRAVLAEQEQGRERARAEASALRAERVSGYIQRMLSPTQGRSPGRGPGYTVRQMLDDVSVSAGPRLTSEPEVESVVRLAIGNAYQDLGLYEESAAAVETAIERARQAGGVDDPTLARALTASGRILHELGRFEESERRLREGVETASRMFGEASAESADAQGTLADVLATRQLYDEAEPYARRALEINRAARGSDDEHVALNLGTLAFIDLGRGRYGEAVTGFRKALAIASVAYGPTHPDVAALRSNLGLALEFDGRLAEAETELRAGIDALSTLVGQEHPVRAQMLSILSSVLREQGRLAEAEAAQAEAISLKERILGPEHASVGSSYLGMTELLIERDRLEEAEASARRALEILRKANGEEHPDVALAMHNLGVVLMLRGENDEAELLMRQSLALRRRLEGDRSPNIAIQLGVLARVLFQRSEFAQAEDLLQQSLAMGRELLRPYHPDLAGTLNYLGFVLKAQAKYAEAEQAYLESLDITRRAYPESHPQVVVLLHNLAALAGEQGHLTEAVEYARRALAALDAGPGDDLPLRTKVLGTLAGMLEKQGKLAEAEPIFRDLADRTRAATGAESPELAGALAQWAQNLMRAERYGDAEAPLRECVAIRERLFPEGHAQAWLRFNAMSLLGGSLLGQGKALAATDPAAATAMYAEAEPLLKEGYRGTTESPNVPPPGAGLDRRREALVRVVELYEAWDAAAPGEGHAVAADRWRATLAEYDAGAAGGPP